VLDLVVRLVVEDPELILIVVLEPLQIVDPIVLGIEAQLVDAHDVGGDVVVVVGDVWAFGLDSGNLVGSTAFD